MGLEVFTHLRGNFSTGKFFCTDLSNLQLKMQNVIPVPFTSTIWKIYLSPVTRNACCNFIMFSKKLF